MHLKKMELFGFKSFAEKSELDLSPGITAIIGPNGCGKSNLVDAVRWALGEQSVKSLRGTRMEEVIFSGSESRKALNFAEVSLTFAEAGNFLNLDYEEVNITRRLFRNGESEYYINKSPCRLKDITELFLDTGLGKDVYSVIGQGRVEEIINSRPEERREIFEEAAGIFKYKLRKREARRRLDETRDNLVRVQDLIYELENQIEPLQIQAAVTRQYRSLKDQIDSEEKKLLSYQLQQSRLGLNKVEKQLQNVNDALIASAAQDNLREKEIHDLKNNLQELSNKKKSLDQKITQVTRELEQHEGELRLLGERNKLYQDQLGENSRRVEQLNLLIQEYAEQKERAAEDLKIKKGELDKSEKELELLREEFAGYQSNPLSVEVENRREHIYRLRNRRETAASIVEELNRRRERLQAQMENQQEEASAILDKSSDLKEKSQKVSLSISDKESQLNAINKEVDEKTGRVKTLSAQFGKLTADKQNQKEKVHGLESKLQILEEQEKGLNGYYRGVRGVMQARKELPGIIGPVADNITVDDQYIQAVESALGSGLQYIIADTEKAVQAAIKHLRAGKLGWATFLPLDIVHRSGDPLERHDGWQNLEGVIGRASELVVTEPAYRKAIDYLLSSVLICRDLDHALRTARVVSYSCRVVTLDGEMINPGGTIRGGSMPGRNAGMQLSRRNEIKNLHAQRNELLSSLEIMEKKIKEAETDLARAEDETAAITAKRDELVAVLSVLQQDSDLLSRESSILDERLSSINKLNGELKAEVAEINQRIESAGNDIDKLAVEIESSESELAAMKEDYLRFSEAKALLEKKITETLVKKSSYREQHDALTARLGEIEKSCGRPAAEIEEISLQSEEYRKEHSRNMEEQEKIKAALQDFNSSKAGLLVELEETNSQLNRIEAELIESEEQGRRRHGQAARQEKRERDLAMEQTRLRTEINFLEMRFVELFDSLETTELVEGYEPEESRIQIENYKEDLEALGEVNLGAIEELARLEDRINFLTEQKNDLHKGEASLQKVLAEIDQRMEYYFNLAFEKINDNFMQTFRELFEGGQVMLKLTDSSNILEAGIEIIAQPPGKKLQNITLLSAGEKVLTAIALVFAILRFKPAPFYLLDEVESTLDDANLSRFNRFLKQAAVQAQFILITHRKRTMEEAETLYGVTMPEPGISNLISLKLENNAISREK